MSVGSRARREQATNFSVTSLSGGLALKADRNGLGWAPGCAIRYCGWAVVAGMRCRFGRYLWLASIDRIISLSPFSVTWWVNKAAC